MGMSSGQDVFSTLQIIWQSFVSSLTAHNHSWFYKFGWPCSEVKRQLHINYTVLWIILWALCCSRRVILLLINCVVLIHKRERNQTGLQSKAGRELISFSYWEQWKLFSFVGKDAFSGLYTVQSYIQTTKLVLDFAPLWNLCVLWWFKPFKSLNVMKIWTPSVKINT